MQGRRLNVANRLAGLIGGLLAPWGEVVSAVLLERSLLEELPEVTLDAEVTLRPGLPADLDEISRLYSSDPWLFIVEGPQTPSKLARARELYLDRLRRGELCFIAMIGDEIAHLNWICFTEANALPGHPVRLRRGEVYTTDALTRPAFRGQGLHAFVLRAMLAYARDRGERHAYTLARVDRPDAHSGLVRLGWRECGRLIYFSPRGRDKAWFLWRHGKLDPLFRPTSEVRI